MDVDNIKEIALANELLHFFDAVREDSRIGPVHISLFIAIVRQWNKNNCQNPVCISTREIMSLSKISGRATYYKSLKELHEYGYIKYKPSHDCLTGSFVQLSVLKETSEDFS